MTEKNGKLHRNGLYETLYKHCLISLLIYLFGTVQIIKSHDRQIINRDKNRNTDTLVLVSNNSDLEAVNQDTELQA